MDPLFYAYDMAIFMKIGSKYYGLPLTYIAVITSELRNYASVWTTAAVGREPHSIPLAACNDVSAIVEKSFAVATALLRLPRACYIQGV